MINKKSDYENGASHSHFGLDTHLTGEVKGKGNYRIDGILEGNLNTSGKVVVGKSGKVLGTVLCAEADISGVVQGNMKVSGQLTLRATAYIEGELEVSKLVVDSGANLNAVCKMKKRDLKMSVEQGENKKSALAQ